MELQVSWLGRVPYREAWRRQHELVAARAVGAVPDQLLLLEHPAVLTLGRQADPSHILARPADLAARGVEVVRTERGGEVTYHGPGQLVAYPIVRLVERGILIRPFVRILETAMIEVCAGFGVVAGRRDGLPGCWCAADGPRPRKIGALGLRVERGVTYHGIALNVTTDLADFELVEACGLPGVTSTSIAREAGWSEAPPSTASVRLAGERFAVAFEAALEAATVRPNLGAARVLRNETAEAGVGVALEAGAGVAAEAGTGVALEAGAGVEAEAGAGAVARAGSGLAVGGS